MITQTIDVDLIPSGINSIKHVHLNQRDVITNGLIFRVWNGTNRFTIPTGATATIEGTKPDGHGFQYSCSISNNQVYANVTYQMTCVAGLTKTEIRIKNSAGNDIGVSNFYLDVEEAGLSDTTDLSETDIPLLIKLATEQMEAAAASAKESESWAIGGTGTREGEDENNSKYWSERSSDYAASSLDYSTASKNSANKAKESEDNAKDSADDSAGYATLSESWAIGGTGTRDGEDTNNSKYWAEKSKSDGQEYAKLSESWAVGSTGEREGEDSNNSKYWALRSAQDAQDAHDTIELVEQYADIIIPVFYLDLDDMNLYQTNYYEESDLVFSLTDDKVLQYELVS